MTMPEIQQKIDGSIVGELLLGELPEWHVGVCTLVVYEPEDAEEEISVLGDGGHRVGRVSTDVWTESDLTGDRVKDLAAIAEDVNDLIQREHDAL